MFFVSPDGFYATVRNVLGPGYYWTLYEGSQFVTVYSRATLSTTISADYIRFSIGSLDVAEVSQAGLQLSGGGYVTNYGAIGFSFVQDTPFFPGPLSAILKQGDDEEWDGSTVRHIWEFRQNSRVGDATGHGGGTYAKPQLEVSYFSTGGVLHRFLGQWRTFAGLDISSGLVTGGTFLVGLAEGGLGIDASGFNGVVTVNSGVASSLKYNLSAGGAPGVNDDSTQGYGVGSLWHH